MESSISQSSLYVLKRDNLPKPYYHKSIILGKMSDEVGQYQVDKVLAK